MSRKLETIRNIGVIAHIDAGKTTVTERMLYYSGAKHRVGEVDKGTTETDTDPEEQDRGITIYSACVTFPWKNVVLNLLDTPGHVDFTAEVERCLRVLDGGVVVFSAREGVEAQSETVWRQADKYAVPRIVFVNKMDREGAQFKSTVDEIKRRLVNSNPVAIQIPVGQGPSHGRDPFRGLIDLVSMKMLQFTGQSAGHEVDTLDIPSDLLDSAHHWRREMLERLYDHSDELMLLALQEQPIPDELIHQVLREATLQRQIQPVLCGSALHGIGVQPVLDAVARYLPSPLDMPPVRGTDPISSDMTSRPPTPDEPFCGLVFKILPAKTGDLYWVRVYSGELKANSRVLNPLREKKENVSQLWQIHATKKEREGQIDVATTGDIVGVIGPRFSITGDTLCDAKNPVLLETIRFPETVISMAIEPESSTERKKLSETLEMMKRQDPTFSAEENEETGQTLISGMGELHLEIIKHRLLRDFKLKVKVHRPRVNYRETIERPVEIVGDCNRQLGGQQLSAKLRIAVEPNPVDDRVLVTSECTPDALDAEFIEAAIDELQSRGAGGGVLGGFPLTKIKIRVLGGQASADGSNPTAFRIAAGEAFELALREAGPVLLEPIMKLDVTTPEEHLGDFVGDLQQRRGEISSTQTRGDVAIIEARAPLSQLFGYSSAMRSLSQGRASCSMEPLEYAPAPPDIAQGFAI